VLFALQDVDAAILIGEPELAAATRNLAVQSVASHVAADRQVRFGVDLAERSFGGHVLADAARHGHADGAETATPSDIGDNAGFQGSPCKTKLAQNTGSSGSGISPERV
jgi:hypothetical protein